MNYRFYYCFLLYFDNFSRCYYNYKKDNYNIKFNNNDNNNKNNDQQDEPKKKKKWKEDKQETDIYSKDNGISPFKWDNVNCALKSTITEFNNLCNYILEIIERIKDENKIIKDSIDIDIKKRIINEILNQRNQYLELKRGIDVDKLLDLIIEYVEIFIKTVNIEDLYQQKYKDLIEFFFKVFCQNSMYKYNLAKYLYPIYIFSEISKKSSEDEKKQKLENFKKIRNNIDLKNHDNKTGIDLYQFFYFINNYIIQFIDKVERKDINEYFYYDCYTIKNNKIKIYDIKKNINNKDIINNNINNIISINLVGRYSSTLSHAISIQKYKNNYYFDSYNCYLKVYKEDITNYNFAKMFENHGNLTIKNTFEYINYIVTLEN